eukprot:163113-Hanusia_phi.AAC.2
MGFSISDDVPHRGTVKCGSLRSRPLSENSAECGQLDSVPGLAAEPFSCSSLVAETVRVTRSHLLLFPLIC